MEEFLDIIRQVSNDDDINVRMEYPYLYLVDDVTDTILLTIKDKDGLSTVVDGNPIDYGITSDMLELIGWAQFLKDEEVLISDDDGELCYEEDV